MLVDTCATESQTRHLLDVLPVRNATAPLTAAITHGHGDHANGAGLVALAGGQLHATPHAATEILAGPHTYPTAVTGVNWGNIPAPETVTAIDQPTTADLGGITAEILPVPHTAHTPGDLVVWNERDGVLFTGDLVFTGVTPLALNGSITGWLDALQWLSSITVGMLVPGHGPITTDTAATLTPLRDYLEWLLTRASSSADITAAYDEAVKRWPNWHDPERHIINYRIAHAETQHGAFNPDKALQEMLLSIGGKITPDL